MMEMVKVNPFPALFDGVKDGEYPKSEMGYIRAYFRNGRWYSVYFPVSELNEFRASEFDQIYRRFTELCPTLGKMRDMCKADAKCTGEWCGYDQYEAYLETPSSLYRFVMRFVPGDYNLYLHCYDRFGIPWSDEQTVFDRVMENYECDDAMINALHFDFDVSMQKAELLGIYAEVMRKVNGDRVEYPEVEGKYTGNFSEFLWECNKQDGFRRYNDDEELDFVN